MNACRPPFIVLCDPQTRALGYFGGAVSGGIVAPE
jgi:hypothetical protein